MSTGKTIGTDKKNDIVLSGKYISKHHAILTEDNGQTLIEDLDSTFGTHVNNNRISEPTKLANYDQVKLGTQIFHWKDHLTSYQEEQQTNPIYIKELFLPFGRVNWEDYKYILLLALGAMIVIPFGVPTVLSFLKNYFTKYRPELREEIDIWHYSELLVIFLGVICLYIFLNVTQKLLRGLLKKNQS